MRIMKYYPNGTLSHTYAGEIIHQTEEEIVFFAVFDRDDRDLGYTVFARGDRFTEYFYLQQHFNILRVESYDTKQLRGWYCNICLPAKHIDNDILFVDLYLDVWVDPAGTVLILDEDEFASATDLTENQRDKAQAGLTVLLRWIEQRTGPFAELFKKST